MDTEAVTALLALLFLGCGAVAGAIHFMVIAKDADMLVAGGSAARIAGLRLGRLVLTVALLALAALQGVTMLLAATGGFMAARQIVLRRLGAGA